MGACASQIGASGAPVLGDPGYREYFSRRGSADAVMFELRRISSVYDRARDAALERMREQARQCKAHAVIDVDLALREDDELRTVEYVATGSAIQLDGVAAADQPRLGGVSAAEYWALRRSGYDAVALAAATCVYFVRPSQATVEAQLKRWRAARPNQELPEFSLAVAKARDACDSRMRAQAAHVDGVGIIEVAMQVHHSIGVGLAAHSDRRRAQRYGNLHLTVHMQGTVIAPLRGTHDHRQGVEPHPVVPLGIPRS